MSEYTQKLTRKEKESIEATCHDLFISLKEGTGHCFDNVTPESGNEIFEAIAKFYFANSSRLEC